MTKTKCCGGPLCQGKERPVSDFWKNRRRSDGLQVWCKECLTEYYRKQDYFKELYKNDEDYRSKKLDYAKSRMLDPELHERKKLKSRIWYENNKDKHAEYRRKNRLVYREKRLLKKYGLTLADVEQILKVQGNACAICGKELSSDSKRPVIDHCHDTGKVRGILCDSCNCMIGFAQDDPAILAKAIEYINKRQQEFLVG
jgi:hypothetical protein